jgi:hypothetical protein
VPYGPRGLIRVPTCEPYPIGCVNREGMPLLLVLLRNGFRPFDLHG